MATLLSDIGGSLAEARLRQGLSLHDAERETRIRTRYLAAMEDERFDELPGEGYAKCFLRSYADFLGLDGAATVAAYSAAYGPVEPTVPVTQVRARRSRPREPVLFLGVVVVALAGVAVAGWKLTAAGEATPPPAAAPAPTPRAEARPEPDAAPAAPASEPVAAARPVPLAPQVLHLTTRADCWLEVRLGGAKGRVLWTGTLKPGRALRLGLGKPVWILAGNPAALRAHVAGKPKALPPAAHTLVVTRAGIRAAR